MDDAEVPRRTITFADDKDQTNTSIPKIRDESTMREEVNRSEFTMEEQLPDRGDFGGGDFLEEGFGGFGDGEMADLGALPGVSDINLDEEPTERAPDKEGTVLGLLGHTSEIYLVSTSFPLS